MDFLLPTTHQYLPEVTVKFRIDEELRSLISPLSKEEFEQLKNNILQWGCLDPLKVWHVPDSDDVILLDGHNRFAICGEHNVVYVTESVALIDRAAAIDWMISNQLGRRNLSARQVSYLRGKQQQQQKKITNPGGSNQPFENTAARLAKQHRVNKSTIYRDVNYAKAVDAIATVTAPEVRQKLLRADSKFTKLDTLKLVELVQEEPGALMEIINEVQQALNKTVASAVVRRSLSEIKKISMSKQTPWLIDFDTAIDAIEWLQGKFKLADLAKTVADKIAEEEAEDWNNTEFDDDED